MLDKKTKIAIFEGLVTISLSTYSANFTRVVFSPVSVLFPSKVNFISDVFALNLLNSSLLFISSAISHSVNVPPGVALIHLILRSSLLLLIHLNMLYI